MRDLVHAFRHRAAVGGVDAAEGLTEFRGDDAAVAAARSPARPIGLEYDRPQPALGDMMRGGESGIARADDDNIGLNFIRQRWKGAQGLGRAHPERVSRWQWGPDLCHGRALAPFSTQAPRRRRPSSLRNENQAWSAPARRAFHRIPPCPGGVRSSRPCSRAYGRSRYRDT